MLKHLFSSLILLLTSISQAQEYFPKNDGVKTKTTTYTAFTNAKIYVTPTQIIEKGTLLIKDEKVENVGTSVNIPKNAIIIDLKGKQIYPSFIDAYSTFGVTPPKGKPSNSNYPQYDPNREGFYWNDHIRPDQNSIDYFKFNTKKAKMLRDAGFGYVNTHIDDGIIQGTGMLVALDEKSNNAKRIILDKSGQYIGTKKSKTSRQQYPTSLMGTMALLKQVNFDAQWYAKGLAKQKDRALEAFIANKNKVQILNADNKNNILRFDKIGDAFGTQYAFVAGGNEYELTKAIKATNATLILPINFPDAYDMSDPYLSKMVSLSNLRTWHQSPKNPKILSDNNIPFALTTHKLKNAKAFKTKLLKAIENGLNPTKALEALTSVPAQLLGKQDVIGTLKSGAYASFLITSGPVFDKKTILLQHWNLGNKYELAPLNVKDIRGTYKFNVKGIAHTLDISGEHNTFKTKLTANNKTLGAKLTVKNQWLQLTFTSPDTLQQQFNRVSAKLDKTQTIKGTLFLANGETTAFLATKLNKATNNKPPKQNTNTEIKKEFPITYPNTAFGLVNPPQEESLLFKNATVWTNEKEGILKNTDVLIKQGKISKIGKNISASSAKVIDATGKHLTSGIIDEHSHIAAVSINESGQNSSAEVSIEDVIDPEDIDIYRNLAGGVTSIQILHGSANPIGGRSAIIKLKWGETADQFIYKNTPKFIKFALGENVKQSNWGDFNRLRFPQTRMGVEQLYIDYFTRAKAYDDAKKSGKPYRKDLELETLAEIINKERFISCHSYIQSEINMLMKVAEQFNFKINTFTHILEGYKVADKMLKHGAGGSTFSDWWAYKYEVNDAIPYNAAIMNSVGVTVAINSDDAEMSRRLNQEAAKTVKYGGVSEVDAWKMVTLNPAELLHIDQRVGSLKKGKDADVVLWSDNPLSIYAKAEKTIIEGKVYFDLENDKQMREAIKKEKNELISLMLKAKNKGLKTKPIEEKEKKLLHCNSEEHQHD